MRHTFEAEYLSTSITYARLYRLLLLAKPQIRVPWATRSNRDPPDLEPTDTAAIEIEYFVSPARTQILPNRYPKNFLQARRQLWEMQMHKINIVLYFFM